MARISNPYIGTYSPAGLRIGASGLKAALKALKIKAPNKKYSGSAYKSGLPKVSETPDM